MGEEMTNKKIIRNFEIRQITEDGLVKVPKTEWGESKFSWIHSTKEDAEEQILRIGDEYTDYVIIETVRVEPEL
jgi:hypothetical protein